MYILAYFYIFYFKKNNLYKDKYFLSKHRLVAFYIYYRGGKRSFFYRRNNMNNYKFSSEMHDAEPTTQNEKIEKVEKKELKIKTEPKKEPKKEPVIKTTTTLLNVREKPSKNSNIMNVLEKGTKVAVVENIGEWSKLLDNTFVMSEYLK